MGLKPLHPPLAPIQTNAEYEALLARFWVLIDQSVELPLLLALREALRDYEHLHPDEPAAHSG